MIEADHVECHRRIVRVRPYRLDVERRIFTREDHVVPLAPKTFDLLLLLVQSNGRALSKQELMSALWPDTFVEEANLTFQISTLRKALGENGAQWIETLPKHGYRFAADIREIPSVHDQAPPMLTPEAATRLTAIRSTDDTKTWIAALITVLILASAVYAGLWGGRPSETGRPSTPEAVPLTAYSGFETEPSLSPDGNQVAFSWSGEAGDNYDIYVKLVGPGEPIPLTRGPARDQDPAWSPDGQLIAFERITKSGPNARSDVYVVPALGGAERRVAADLAANYWNGWGPKGSVTWTPDSKWLAHWAESTTGGIWLFAVDGSGRRLLTDSGAGSAFSEDGRRMAFIKNR